MLVTDRRRPLSFRLGRPEVAELFGGRAREGRLERVAGAPPDLCGQAVRKIPSQSLHRRWKENRLADGGHFWNETLLMALSPGIRPIGGDQISQDDLHLFFLPRINECSEVLDSVRKPSHVDHLVAPGGQNLIKNL